MGTTIYSEVLTLGGTNFYYLSVDQLPSHTHTFTTDEKSHTHKLRVVLGSDGDHCVNFNGTGALVSGDGYGNFTTSSGTHTHSGTTDPSGNGAVINNRPAFIILVNIMKL